MFGCSCAPGVTPDNIDLLRKRLLVDHLNKQFFASTNGLGTIYTCDEAPWMSKGRLEGNLGISLQGERGKKFIGRSAVRLILASS